MATGTPLLEAQQPHTDHSDDVPAEHDHNRHCGVASNMPKQKQQETTQYGESHAWFREVSHHAIQIMSTSFHRRVMDEASIHVGPHAMKFMSTFISQTCHRRGYTPRHSLNNTPQGAAGSAEQINTPQGTAVAQHLNKINVTRSRHRHVKDETSELMSKVCEGRGFMKQSLQTTCTR